MARKEITTPLDLKNMDNHNKNYDELYNLIDETDRRISEDMWEEIKNANTMKMLKPVQTAADLPHLADLLTSEEADKSLVTVIDEQRVYGFVNGEWQPFNQIDLDPFEPFKEELAEIVAAYEKQIQNITQEVQSTKDSAIESIESTQSQAESQISTIRDEMTTQASDLTALFNDSMDKLTSKQDTALAEVDSAKQAAITALEDFNNTDTSNWQKYKLTEENGDRIRVSDIDPVELDTGFYQIWNTHNMPALSDGSGSYWNVDVLAGYDNTKQIRATLSYANRVFQKTIHKGEDSGWKELTGMAKTVLFSGSLAEVNKNISLKDDPRNYSFIIIELSQIGGDDTAFVRFRRDYASIRTFNLGNSGSGSTLIETVLKLDSADSTKIYIENSVRIETEIGTDGEEYVPKILKLVGVK